MPFTRGPLRNMLRNRFYIGEVDYKGEVCPGEQPAILERELFEAVQTRLTEQRTHHVTKRSRSESLLQGRIVDDRHNRMTPTMANKGGVRYRYYVSAVLTQGQPELAGSVKRVPAAEIEALVLQALRKHMGSSPDIDDRALVAAHVERVQVRQDTIVLTIRRADFDDEFDVDDGRKSDSAAQTHPASQTVMIPWRKTATRRGREIIVPDGATDRRPARSETRDKLVASIGQGRRWLAEITSGSVTIEDLAGREGCSVRRITMMLSLAFLAPALVRATVDGRLPRGIGVSRLFDAPAEWTAQHKMLGLQH